MEIVAWGLVAVLAVAVGVLFFRKPEDPYAGALDRLTRELEREGSLAAEAPGEPSEVARLRRVVAEGWEPIRVADEEDPGDRALEGLVRYLREAAVTPLKEGLSEGRPLRPAVEEVVDALEDLEFYAREAAPETPSRQNVLSLIQEVVREYNRQMDIPVKVRASAATLPAQLPAEGFKDALFMLLANAGRFGQGQTITVEAEAASDGVRVRVLDRGQGFSAEAMERAFDPFWSTDPDAVGLGLTHARRLLHARGLRLRIGNRDEGGAEAVILVPGE